MGLLDDAIREHLDLKRRRGADPDEVARQEHEALGPPRTGQFAAPADAGDAADAGAPAYDSPEATERDAGLPPLSDDTEEAPAAVAASFADEPDAPELGADPWLDEREDVQPTAAADQATTEFTPPGVEGSEPPPAPRPTGEEDVLEETPDFLQETPEHDRLWFEQRPPRDFDFDK